MDLSNHPRPTAPVKTPPRARWQATCAACETVRFMSEPVLPDGWEVETIRDSEFAFCPDCAIDLPKGEEQ